MFLRTPLIALIVSLLIQSPAPAGLVFNFVNSTNNAEADAAFELAAAQLSPLFTDDVVVNVRRGFVALDPNVLGQANSNRGSVTFDNFRLGIEIDRTSANDQTFYANLPTTSSFSVLINQTTNSPNVDRSVPYIDSTGTNTARVQMTTAAAKAIGFLSGNNPILDAEITFSSSFSWDFDNRDGIGANLQDFVGVATHELIHAMGFTSAVDVLDQNANSFADDAFLVTSLDFTRHSTLSFQLGADLDFTADNRAKYFSIDGGQTNLTPNIQGGFSRGILLGDGRQASHWRDNLGLGIMDPTANAAGQLNFVSSLDLLALDVIGWDLASVPEPSTLVLLSSCTLIYFVRHRRKTVSP